MDTSIYTPDHDEFRAAVRAFITREIEPDLDRHIADRGLPRGLWTAAGRMGLLGLDVPEEHGGTGAGDYRYNAVLIEELAKVNLALASSLSIHFDVVAPYLVQLTTPEQKRRWLPGFCTGDLVTAIAMTEPSGGSDLAALRTSAVRDGDSYVINGSKTFITNGFSADLIVVAARTTPGTRSAGITLFVVEGAADGLQRPSKMDKIGQPQADTAELFFTDVRVPATNVIGEVDHGFAHMMRGLPQERVGAAVANLAHAAQILEETIAYAHERTAFGQKIGSFQHNRFLLADMVTRIDVTRAFVDRCVRAHAEGGLTAVDAAKAKWWTADVQNDVLDHCVQVYGGYGYMREYRVARAWADARVTRIWAGSNEIMKEIIGRDLGFS